jgi:hypothetical protein
MKLSPLLQYKNRHNFLYVLEMNTSQSRVGYILSFVMSTYSRQESTPGVLLKIATSLVGYVETDCRIFSSEIESPIRRYGCYVFFTKKI